VTLAAAEPLATAVLLAVFGLLMAFSVLFSRLMERVGVPVVLLFLVLGMLAGSEGVLGVDFDNYAFAYRVGTIALVLILFEGGLNTTLSAIRRSAAPASVLATAGVAATAALVALFARLLGLTWTEAWLLGAVVSSTDAATVFAVLRGGGIRLARRVGTTLEVESGLNDPLAVILTMALVEAARSGSPISWTLAPAVALQLLIGAGVGIALGLGSRSALRRLRLSTAGLYAVLTLALGFAAYGGATLVSGSGFLAVYVAAVVLGNGPVPYRAGLARIHEAIAWLSQIVMFLMLGLLVFPSRLVPVASVGLLVGLFLAFVARPLAVLVCLLPFRYPMREIGYIGWVGLRGAVPIILATFPVLGGVPGADRLFHIVFFVVVVNAIVPGATLRRATRWAGLLAPDKPPPPAVLEINSRRLLRGELLSFHIDPSLAVCGARLAHVAFPRTASTVLMVRGDEMIAPRGDTELRTGDHVYVLCRPEDRAFIELLFGRPQEGEHPPP
jgi:cell volume regulation protein A